MENIQNILTQSMTELLASLLNRDDHQINVVYEEKQQLIEHSSFNYDAYNTLETKDDITDEKYFIQNLPKVIKLLSIGQNKKNSTKSKIKCIEDFATQFFKNKINAVDMNSLWAMISSFTLSGNVADSLVIKCIYTLFTIYLDNHNIDGVISVFTYIHNRIKREVYAFQTSGAFYTNNIMNNIYVINLKTIINKLQNHTFCRNLATALQKCKHKQIYNKTLLNIITTTIQLYDNFRINFYDEQDFLTNFINNFPVKDEVKDITKKITSKYAVIDCNICMSDEYKGECYYFNCGHYMCKSCFNNHFRENYKTIILDRSYFVIKCPYCREYNQVYKNIANKILNTTEWLCSCGILNKLCHKWCSKCPLSVDGLTKWTCSGCTYLNITEINKCIICGNIKDTDMSTS